MGKPPGSGSQKKENKFRKAIEKIDKKIGKLKIKIDEYEKKKQQLRDKNTKGEELKLDPPNDDHRLQTTSFYANQRFVTHETANLMMKKKKNGYEEQSKHIDMPDEDNQPSDAACLTRIESTEFQHKQSDATNTNSSNNSIKHQTLQRELTSSREENQDLKTKYAKLLEEIESTEFQHKQSDATNTNSSNNSIKHQTLQRELTSSREENQDLKTKYAKLLEKIESTEFQHKQSDATNTNSSNNSIKHQTLQRELTSSRKENQDLKTKYAKLLEDTGKSMQRETEIDSTKTENISQKCRPSVIAEKYYNLSFQTASQIKTKLTHKHSTKWQDVLRKYICNLYVNAGEKQKNRLCQVIEIIGVILAQPMCTVTKGVSTEAGNSSGYLSSETMHYIMETLKANSHEIDMKDVTQNIMRESFEALQTELTDEPYDQWKAKLTTDKDMAIFAESVCRLAWQMALQQPAMSWDVSGMGKKPDEDRQDVLPSKDMEERESDGNKVIHYLEPTLIHGDQILLKGRVVVE